MHRTDEAQCAKPLHSKIKLAVMVGGLVLSVQGLAGCTGSDNKPVATVATPAPASLKAVLASPGTPAPGAPMQISNSGLPGPATAAAAPAPAAAHNQQAAAAPTAPQSRPAGPTPPISNQSLIASIPAGAAPANAASEEAKPATAQAYAAAPPNSSVNNLIGLLRAGAHNNGAPALVNPDAAAAGTITAATPAPAAPQNPIEQYRASLPPPQTTTTLLSAPGLMHPDKRIEDALTSHSSKKANGNGIGDSNISQKDIESLF